MRDYKRLIFDSLEDGTVVLRSADPHDSFTKIRRGPRWVEYHYEGKESTGVRVRLDELKQDYAILNKEMEEHRKKKPDFDSESGASGSLRFIRITRGGDELHQWAYESALLSRKYNALDSIIKAVDERAVA